MPYKECWEYQRTLFEEMLRRQGEESDFAGYILFVEHPAVYTLGKSGKAHRLTNYSWRRFWGGFWIGRHPGFSPALYGEELEICHGKHKDMLSKGNPRIWAVDMARQCILVYRWASPDCELSLEAVNGLEPVQDLCLARAGFRLAALLNDIFK